MSASGDTDKPNGNDTDSLFSHEVSPCDTSPSSTKSTSTQSRSGSSPDEGVGLNESASKRNLLESCLFEEQDKPIDLSLKKLKKKHSPARKVERSDGDTVLTTKTDNNRNDTKNPIIDSTLSPCLHHTLSSQHDRHAGTVSKYHALPNSLVPQSYMPWTLGQRPGRVPYPTIAMSGIWHPAFMLSQGGRPTTPGLSPYSYSIPPSVFNASFPTSDALSHLYNQKILAEFSRVCARTGSIYGSKPVGGETMPNISPRKDLLSAGVQAIALHDDADDKNEDVKNDIGFQAKKEKLSPHRLAFPVPKKRKFDERSAAGIQHSPAKVRSPFHHGYSTEYRDASCNGTSTFLDPLPTMVPKQTSISSGNIHANSRPVDFKPCRYPCGECGRTYATYGGLIKHSKTHRDPGKNNVFKCKTCNKEYNSLGALKMHIRTHTLPCKCHICGKAFSRTWLLQGHIRTHTGEKPYQCNICTRAFADRSNLRAHMQTHQSVKRYACTECDKTFSRISLLNRHQMSGCAGKS